MDVFVYGSLTEPARVRELLDSFAFVGAATLRGLCVVEGEYPTLAPPEPVEGDRDRPGDDDGDRTSDDGVGDDAARGIAAVGGRLLRTDEMATLDEYERVDDGLYTRVSVPLCSPDGDPEGEVAVYVGDPGRLGAGAVWPGAGAFPDRVRHAVADAGVTVHRRPER